MQEWRVLHLYSVGLTSHEIAEEMFLSFHTIKTHTRRIRNRWKAKTTAQLIYMACCKGYLGTDVKLPWEDSNLQQTP